MQGAGDTNILYANLNLKSLEKVVNTELHKLYVWLTSNKLTLNINKSNFVIFHPSEKKLTFQPVMGFIRATATLAIDNRFLTSSLELKCLGTSFGAQKQKISIPRDSAWPRPCDHDKVL